MKRFGIVALLFLFNVSFAQNKIESSERIAQAIRVLQPPKIDGNLDDEVWKKAPIVTDFIQNSPNPGDKATQKTEVRIIYDNTALYISATMYDVSRDSIKRQYSQRDEEDNTDIFAVFLDTYDDDQSGYGFVVHPTGVQWDARYSQEQGQDVSWNAVWESKVTIDETNWYVEMKIPYSAIRFPEKDVQDWGVNFARKIRRKREFSFWSELDPELNGFVNQWGSLEGIKNIKAPIRLMFSPYISTYVEHFPYNIEGSSNISTSINGGLDLKYGLSDAFTLDMTLIPDFGQVQSDNQVLNLSPFEVQFNENRSFFMEGTELFNKGNLFYSRRLGGTPINFHEPYNELGTNEMVTENPSESQLVNASKVSGRTKKGLGIGVFNGITKAMYATILDTITGQSREILTDPFTNYNVLVLDQNLKNNSYVTLINTNVARMGSQYDANVTGALFKFNTKTNMYAVSGGGVLSQKYFSSSDVSLGHSANLSLRKDGGNLKLGLYYQEESDTYDPNDLGFLYNNNSREGRLIVGYNVYKPYWKLLQSWSSLNIGYERLFNPDEFVNFYINLNAGGTFTNWLTANVFYVSEPVETYDFFEPRVWGRYYSWQSSNNIGGNISSDYRKRIVLDPSGNYRKFSTDGRYRFNFNIEPRFRFSDKLSLLYSFGRYHFVMDEGAAIDLNGAGTIIGDDIIFGKRDQTTYENVLSTSYIFTNRMGLTFRLRHYWSTVNITLFMYWIAKGTWPIRVMAG
ncbi:MAG: carbohydrate binding family 9 domain-containing protein [Flavobacteriales bacterium]|nr:carbohydrate binding family 9 domain-containing protein [Flavobacteriales bacterium]